MAVVPFASKLQSEVKYEVVLDLADFFERQMLGSVNTITGLAEVPANQVLGFVEMVAKIDGLLAAGGYSNAD